jgi:hypothetical protein
VGGIRLVVGDLRTEVTKTRKDGSRGRLRIDYGDARDRQAGSRGWRRHRRVTLLIRHTEARRPAESPD